MGTAKGCGNRRKGQPLLDTILAILATVAVLAVLIIAHELGHLFTAKAFGIRIDEFGLGYPPRIFGFKRGQMTYSINWLPLGGFVKIAGQEDPNVPDGLAGKGVGARFLVLSAGVIVNALLPIVLFSIAFMIPTDTMIGDVTVNEVAVGSPAEAAGVLAGDTIISFDGHAIENNSDLSRYIQINLGEESEMVVAREDGSQETLSLIPRWKPPEEEGAIGVSVTTEDAVTVTESEPFFTAIGHGVTELGETFVLFKNAILGLFVGSTPMNIGGPVAIAQITGEAAQAGLSPLLQFAAFLSMNFALLNILPLPALDGGRIVFVLLEWVRRGKRISAKREGTVHFIGFVLLMGFILAVTFQDIGRIISGNSLLP